MKPGEVIWVEFPSVVQNKRRPAIVLSTSTYHVNRPDVIVGLVTSQTAKATAPTDHLIAD
jgi:mRNA interferase MazF